MRFLKLFFSAELVSTLFATAISGGIVYAITGWGMWGCICSGYLVTELMTIANKVTTITTELQINNYKVDELQKQNLRLSDQVWDLQQKFEDARAGDRKVYSPYE